MESIKRSFLCRLAVREVYRTAEMPPVKTGLRDGELAWRQQAGGRSDGLN
jgi:hypothetical protein